jgi:tRNA1(Val) A37 N6-methylase TrmN6
MPEPGPHDQTSASREPDGQEPDSREPQVVPAGRLSVWATAQRSGPAQRRGRYTPVSVRHPARMLPAIAAHAVAAYTRPGDLVLDPMCGIGTTLVEAVHAGRDAIGVDCEPAWTDLAAANADLARTRGATGRATVITGDATALPSLLPPALRGRVALVITSPPYGPTVHGRVRPTPGAGVVKAGDGYGHHRRNLAHRDLSGLIAGLTDILTGCAAVLRPGGTVVITARPWRTKGRLVDLPSAAITAGRAAGLQPAERCVALLAAVTGSRLQPRPSFFQLHHVRAARAHGIPLHLIAHEDVLVLTARGLERVPRIMERGRVARS